MSCSFLEDNTHTRARTCAHARMYARTHARTHTHTRARTHARITLSPNAADPLIKKAKLTRITGDALGYSRPTQDLVLGPSARILHRSSGIRKVTGVDAAFIPATDFVDGNNVLSLEPTTPVSVYQFGFAAQRSLSVNGIEVETLHPGSAFNLGLRGDALREYLSLFPHKRSFEEFGLMNHPRLRMRDLDLLG